MAVEIDPSYMKHKKGIQKGMFICFRILSYFIALLLFYILGFIIVKGISVINWDFLTQAPTGHDQGRYLARHCGYILLDDRKCFVLFPCRRNERHLHERICTERKIGKLHPYHDQ